jgi:hypothetical protein
MRGRLGLARIAARAGRWLFALAFNKTYYRPLAQAELIRRVRRG